MKNKIRVEFILDESSSMGGQRQSVISGFNEQIDQMRIEEPLKEVEYIVSLTKFASEVTNVFTNRPLSEVQHITEADYTPNGMTALHDAIGLRIQTAEVGEDDVLVYIFTDGYENASRQFDRSQIMTLIDMRQKQGWGVTYFGADMNAVQAAQSIGVVNAVNYAAVNTSHAFAATESVRSCYTANVKSGVKGMMKSHNLAAFVDQDALNNVTTTTTTTTTTTGKN